MNKCKFLISIFIVFSFSCFAQEKQGTVAKKEKRKLFAIGFSYEPKYCFRTNSSSKMNYTTYNGYEWVSDYSYNSKNDVYKSSYSIGLGFTIIPTKYLSLNIGLMYAKMGFQTKNLDTIISVNNPEFMLFRADTTFNQNPIAFNYSYISIPMNIEYIINLKKFELHTGAGFSFNVLREAVANGKNIAREVQTGRYEPNEKSRHLIYYNLHLGFYYNFNKAIALALIPNFNYQKDPIKSNNVHLYSLGTEIKLLIRF